MKHSLLLTVAVTASTVLGVAKEWNLPQGADKLAKDLAAWEAEAIAIRE